MTITGAQIRAARALIRWTAGDLAKAARLGVMTIRRAEAVDGEISATAANAAAIQSSLEAAGVAFLDAGDDEGPGVRLRRASVAARNDD